MKAFVINLEKDIERKKSMQEQLQEINLDAEFITAVYGKVLTDEQLHEICPDFDKIALTLGEVGCSMSHLNAYKKMIDDDIPIALVLEDDVIFNDDLLPILSHLEKHSTALSATPYVFLLNKTNEYLESFKKPLIENYKIVSVIDAACTFGYILNLSAAKKLYQYLKPVRFVADEWKLFREQGIIKLKGIIPPIIHTSFHSLDSSIGERECSLTNLDIKNRRRTIFTQIKLLLWRVFIRTWLKKIRP
ncbi:glycosyltransferase family 25 protein [Xenorhabdus bovienii]|uniref:glycosyltransferase family 25 protein n=1 Tax=Xenorhabdus bovienii TaxID=40576 RepID=UPI00237D2E12|nr:glycosyltransferase family 25 protein [Xenorhabdus bovienii]MDE1496128.1 glycosyltransferase family 25 protein [Xenorhabdus bovienii]MDE9474156.1 glycosyltransferase family 25 protein [Xenorhabdus bovienii]